MSDAQCLEDVAGAMAFLKAQPGANGKVGVIGHCSGGRQSYLSACNLELDAAVDCYGGGVVATPDQLTPERPVAVIDMTKDLHCPLLGLFGTEDANPSPEHVARMDQELKAYAKTYEFHAYEGAGHAFLGGATELQLRGRSRRLAPDLGLLRPSPRGLSMCTYLTSTEPIAGTGLGAGGWFPIEQAVVYFDHPQHAPVEARVVH